MPLELNSNWATRCWLAVEKRVRSLTHHAPEAPKFWMVCAGVEATVASVAALAGAVPIAMAVPAARRVPAAIAADFETTARNAVVRRARARMADPLCVRPGLTMVDGGSLRDEHRDGDGRYRSRYYFRYRRST